jgi:hypothetical protein
LERNASGSKVLLDLSDSSIRAKVRPLVITVAFLMLFVSVAGVLLTVPLGRNGYVDFRTFYTVGYMVRTGHGSEIHNPEKCQEFQNKLVGNVEGLLPFNHLAYEGLVYAPFSYLGYKSAYLTFLGFNLIALTCIVWVLRPLFIALSEVWSLLPIAIVVCFLPVAMALIEGQDSLLLLFLFACSTVEMYKQNDFGAGVLIGLTLFKFQYAIPVVLLFLVWKRWTFLRGFASSGIIVLALSLWITSLSGVTTYFHSLTEVSAKYSSANGVLYGIHPDGMPNLRGIAYMLTGGSVTAAHLIVLVGSAVVMFWGALKRPSLPVALLAAMLVSYHQVIADSSLLVLPVGLIMAGSVREISTRKDHLVLVLACVVLVAPTVLLFANTRFYLLVLPVVGLFGLWNGVPTSPKVLKG